MNFTKILSALATTTVLACASAHAAPINLVTNGGFETTTKGVGQINSKTTATGWTSAGYNFVFNGATADSIGAIGDYGVVKLWGPASGSNNGLGVSPTGGNFLAADGAFGVAPITQMINGLVVGQSYDLSFYWAGAQQATYNGAILNSYYFVETGGYFMQHCFVKRLYKAHVIECGENLFLCQHFTSCHCKISGMANG